MHLAQVPGSRKTGLVALFAYLLLAGASGWVAEARAADPRTTVRVELRPIDGFGTSVPARLQAWNAQGYPAPDVVDSVLITHYDARMGQWFYPEAGSAVLNLPVGTYTFQASHGFEWRPARFVIPVVRDTVINMRLTKMFDLRTQGWFSGDAHVHGHHPPIDIPLTPSDMMRITDAEDLGLTWALDEGWNFTGGPSPLSTSSSILYFTTEWRNQVYGHAAFLNLHQMLGEWCCEPPLPAWPMLSMTHESWHPDTTQAMVLAHPENGAGFFDDQGWPAWGLGRELPVLATSGNLDILDVASYSDVNDVRPEPWTALLDCGFQVPISAGTDAIVNRYFARPPGGYRVFVHEKGGTHDPSRWVSALRAGRSFVSNAVLIPEFTIDGAEAGSVLERPGPSTTVRIRLHTASLLPPGYATVLVNGTVARTWYIPWDVVHQEWSREDDLVLTEPSWIAVRIDGQTTQTWTSSNTLFAMTGAVQVKMDGRVPRRTVSAGALADWVDSLQIYVEDRGNWPNAAAHTDVLQRLAASRAFFNSLFRTPPEPFDLLTPAEGETLAAGSPVAFDWADAIDPEAGDRLTYRLEVSPDSTFQAPWTGDAGAASALTVPANIFNADSGYYWRVAALDRAGNTGYSAPAWRRLQIGPPETTAAGADDPSHVPLRLVPRPNPSHGSTRVDLAGGRFTEGQIEVFSPGGARVARIGTRAGTGSATWDGLDEAGRPVSSGVYWVRFSAAPGATGVPATRRIPSARLLLLR